MKKDTTPKEVKKFDKWMHKIKNIHLSSNEQMSNAYNRIAV